MLPKPPVASVVPQIVAAVFGRMCFLYNWVKPKMKMQQQQQQKNQKYPLFGFTIITNGSDHIQTAWLLFNGDIVQNWNWHMWFLILQWREPQPPSSCQLKLANLISLSAWCLHRDDLSLHLVQTLFLSWATPASCRAASISPTTTGNTET